MFNFSKTNIIILIFLAFFGFFLLLNQAKAIGQITEPIVINNALRGQEFEQTLSLFNTEKTDLNFTLIGEGDIGPWVSFYNKSDKERVNPIASTTIASGQRQAVIAIFNVPADTPNGEYKGLVSILSAPVSKDEENTTVANIKQKISRTVTINVSDKEKIDLKTDIRVSTFNLEIGKKFNILVTYHNNGNVALKPQVQIKTKQNNKIFSNLIVPYPENQDAVKPLKTKEVPAIEVPTDKVKPGKMDVEVDILLDNKSIQNKKILVGVMESVKPSTEQQATVQKFSLKSLFNRTNFPIIVVIIFALAIIMFLTIRLKNK